jgi:hypothetical protein
MRLRWTLCVALMLTTLVVGGQSSARGGWGPFDRLTTGGMLTLPFQSPGSNRLADLAARQDLCDAVCRAMADGRITPRERVPMLLEAKSILTPAEYLTFKRSLDRLSPPTPSTPQPVARTTKKPTALVQHTKRPAVLAQQRVPRPAAPTASTAPSKATVPARGPVIPASATLPDRMASPSFFR